MKKLPLMLNKESPRGGGVGGVHVLPSVVPSSKLMGMSHWTGSHFYDWIDYNGVAFLQKLLIGSHSFRVLRVRKSGM